MRYTDPLNHLFLLIVIISIGILVTSCANWTPVDYIDAPVQEPEPERVVLKTESICNMDLCT